MIAFEESAWEDYLYFKIVIKKSLKKLIHSLKQFCENHLVGLANLKN